MESMELTEAILNDPLIIAAALVLLAGAIVLVWAIIRLFKPAVSEEDLLLSGAEAPEKKEKEKEKAAPAPEPARKRWRSRGTSPTGGPGK